MSDFLMRRGRLQIPSQLVESDPELVQRIYAMILPFRIEHLLMEVVFDVYAISKFFEPCKEGIVVPFYNIVYDTDTDEISFERVDSSAICSEEKSIESA